MCFSLRENEPYKHETVKQLKYSRKAMN